MQIGRAGPVQPLGRRLVGRELVFVDEVAWAQDEHLAHQVRMLLVAAHERSREQSAARAGLALWRGFLCEGSQLLERATQQAGDLHL